MDAESADAPTASSPMGSCSRKKPQHLQVEVVICASFRLPLFGKSVLAPAMTFSKKQGQKHMEYTEKQRRRLRCDGCGLTFAYAKSKDGPPIFDFPDDGRPPSLHCDRRLHNSRCRFQVFMRREGAADDLERLWGGANVLWATVVMAEAELTLDEAVHVIPSDWSKRTRRLIDAAVGSLPSDQRKSVRGIGAVEPGVVEIRKRGVRVGRRVVMHGHILVWGIPRLLLKTLLDTVVEDTKTVIRPVEVKRAKTPAGALAYAWKHQGDHRAQVRDDGKKAFKRRLEEDEAEILRRWSGFPSTDAEVLVRLRRTAGGGITGYGTAAAQHASSAREMADAKIGQRARRTRRRSSGAHRDGRRAAY